MCPSIRKERFYHHSYFAFIWMIWSLAPSSCNLESYVDDSKLFLSFPLTEVDAAFEKLEQDLLSVAQWCCENHLLINPDKTKLLFLGTRQMLSRLPQNPSISFLGAKLKPIESAKDLGVILDPHSTYHISKTVSSCFSKLYQINRVKESFDKETLKLLITSLVFSKMLYCSTVWSNTSTQNINKLQSIQNLASKIIMNSRNFDHVTPLLHQLLYYTSWIHSYFDNVMTKFMINNRTDAWKTDVNLFIHFIHVMELQNIGSEFQHWPFL